MGQKRKIRVVILIIGIVLIGLAAYLYYKQETVENQGKQTASDTTTESEDATENINSSDVVTEAQEAITDEAANITKNESATEETKQEASTTTEKKQNAPLPDNYEWDEKQWGEPPQIIYDFAENQEKFDLIVNEVDSILIGEDGFSTWRENGKIYYDSEYGNQLSSELKKDIDYLLKNTQFYDFTKYESGHWDMEYNQEEDRNRYAYSMVYDPEMTEEEVWGVGYIKVVGDWYFNVSPLA